VEQDFARARSLLEQAASAGYAPAAQQLHELRPR
jgi:hypothetical protein